MGGQVLIQIFTSGQVWVQKNLQVVKSLYKYTYEWSSPGTTQRHLRTRTTGPGTSACRSWFVL